MMVRTFIRMAAFCAAMVPGVSQSEDYFPRGADWETISADEAGAYSRKLEAAVEYGLAKGSRAVIVVRHGRILAEGYAPTWGPSNRQEMFSAAKSVVGIVAGMALSDRKFRSLDQSVSDFIPTWRGTEKERITVRHMLTMTSGLKQRGLPVRNIQGDQFAQNSATPLDHEPGTHWEYNTPAFHLMFHIIAKATGESFESYAQRRLIGPLQMENWSWVTGQGKGFPNKATNYYSAEGTARDMAKIGLLMLRKGKWHERQLVSARYVGQATRPSQELNPAYGLLWWVNAKPVSPLTIAPQTGAPPGPSNGMRFPQLPADTFAALGHQNQDIVVVPSLDLVVVRQGDNPRELNFATNLLKQVVDAIKPIPTMTSASR